MFERILPVLFAAEKTLFIFVIVLF